MAKDTLVEAAYGSFISEMDWYVRLGNQLVGAVTITVWTLFNAGVLFKVLGKAWGGLRTEHGQGGLDVEEFGMPAYTKSPRVKSSQDLENKPLIALAPSG